MKIEISLPDWKEVEKAIGEELRIEEILENYFYKTKVIIRGGLPINYINGIAIYTWQGQLEGYESDYHIMVVKWEKCEEIEEGVSYHIGDPIRFSTINAAQEHIQHEFGDNKVWI